MNRLSQGPAGHLACATSYPHRLPTACSHVLSIEVILCARQNRHLTVEPLLRKPNSTGIGDPSVTDKQAQGGMEKNGACSHISSRGRLTAGSLAPGRRLPQLLSDTSQGRSKVQVR